jgi:transposase-like protein
MPNRKWSAQEEQELLEAYKQGASVEALAQKYKRSPEAIKMKLKRLGLDVVAAKLDITGQLNIPNELPSLEEVLKIVAAAIMKACEPGLGKTELQRLDVIATLYKAYAAGLEQYVGYKKIEAKLLELEKKYAVLAEKAKGSQAQSNSA